MLRQLVETVVRALRSTPPPSRRPIAVNEGVAEHVEVRTTVRCVCGSVAVLTLASLTDSATCPRCHRTWRVRRLSYQLDRPNETADLHVSLGYIIERDAANRLTLHATIQ